MAIYSEDENGQLTCIKADKSLSDLVDESNAQKVDLGKPTSSCVKDINLLGEDK